MLGGYGFAAVRRIRAKGRLKTAIRFSDGLPLPFGRTDQSKRSPTLSQKDFLRGV